MITKLSRPFLLSMVLFLPSCTAWHPLEHRKPEQLPTGQDATGGVRATFLGNTTILITDGKTRLLVDGFFSRPGAAQTLLGKIGPDHSEIRKQLQLVGIKDLDAVLVGHAHYDHSIDAPIVARDTGAKAVGSEAYAMVHTGTLSESLPIADLITIRKNKEVHRFGRFTVTFVESDHVGSHSCLQRAVEGDITEPIRIPARYSDYKCGTVYALHIAHPEGNMAVITSAGAKKKQFKDMKADVVFLGIGLISKESPQKREIYWQETVCALDPQVVAPVHWDNFSKKLEGGLQPMPRYADDVKAAFDWVELKSGNRRMLVMDLRDYITIQNGKVL